MEREKSYRLNVVLTKQECVFTLLDRGHSVTGTVDYPNEISNKYEQWKEEYRKAYDSESLGRSGGFGGGLSASHISPPTRCENAEKALLKKFQHWLESAELSSIRNHIRAQSNQDVQKSGSLKAKPAKLAIACNDETLSRLPWELWDLGTTSPLTIYRAPLNQLPSEDLPQVAGKRGKYRILAILADENLDLKEARQAINALRKPSIQVELLRFQTSNKSAEQFKESIIEALSDNRGWDLLIYCGHGNDKEDDSGILQLASKCSLGISEVEHQLKKAQQLGLKTAIFISCRSFRTAESLIQQGFRQVVAMREKIHRNAGQKFLAVLCTELTDPKECKPLSEAIVTARQALLEDKRAYPSGSLVPSCYQHPPSEDSDRQRHSDDFSIEHSFLRRLRNDWQPSRPESIALSVAIILSFATPLQDFLLETRTAVQTVYKEITHPLYEMAMQRTSRTTSPDILWVAIDQASINQARERVEGFEINPMDREYLALLINRLSGTSIGVVGINYLLDDEKPKQEQLSNALRSAVESNQTWFVLGADLEMDIQPLAKMAAPNWSLRGDLRFLPWDVSIPVNDPFCAENCPFAYLAVLASQFNEMPRSFDTPYPSIDRGAFLQDEISEYLKSHDDSDPLPVTQLPSAIPARLRWVLDFSIPTQAVYHKVTAEQLLSQPLDFKVLDSVQIAFISSDGYDRAEDRYPVPLALQLRCQWKSWNRYRHREDPSPRCPKFFTGGEAAAYMAYQMLEPRLLIAIPDVWLLVLGIFAGKFLSIRLKYVKVKNSKVMIILLSTLAVYNVIGLHLYITPGIVLPLSFPSLVIFAYIAPRAMRQISAY